jgi:hypothetical protein
MGCQQDRRNRRSLPCFLELFFRSRFLLHRCFKLRCCPRKLHSRPCPFVNWPGLIPVCLCHEGGLPNCCLPHWRLPYFGCSFQHSDSRTLPRAHRLRGGMPRCVRGPVQVRVRKSSVKRKIRKATQSAKLSTSFMQDSHLIRSCKFIFAT